MSATRKVQCGECGALVDEPADTPADERKPCPKCGSTRRAFSLTLEAAITATSSITRSVSRVPTAAVKATSSITASVIRAPAVAARPTERMQEAGFRVMWYRWPDGLLLVLVHNDGDDPRSRRAPPAAERPPLARSEPPPKLHARLAGDAVEDGHQRSTSGSRRLPPQRLDRREVARGGTSGRSSARAAFPSTPFRRAREVGHCCR
jgi:hypothetical protein